MGGLGTQDIYRAMSIFFFWRGGGGGGGGDGGGGGPYWGLEKKLLCSGNT